MDVVQFADLSFTITLALTILVILYAMAMISRELRLLQYQLSLMETELKLVSEEINTLANQGGKGPAADQAPAEGKG